MGERIDIVVAESGAKQAQANIAAIGAAADVAAPKVDKLREANGRFVGSNNALKTSVQAATPALQQQAAAANLLTTQTASLSSAMNLLKVALAGFGLFELISQYKTLSDTFSSIISRLKLVTTSAKELVATEQALFESSNRTRSSFESTANLYLKLAQQASQLGVDQKSLIPTIETINQLIAISGATAQEAQSGLMQFSQGLASNRFQGDELRSVLENLPALGQAIAKGLGVTTAGLRDMGEKGQLSAKLILDAIAKQGPEITKQFASITPTIGGALQVLQNNILQTVGTWDQLMGTSSKVATVILALANNIGTLIRTVAVAAATIAAFYIGLQVQAGWAAFSAGIAAVTARIVMANTALGMMGIQLTLWQKALMFVQAPLSATTGLFAALNAVIRANPIVAFITILGAAAAALYYFGNAVKLNSDGSITALGAVVGTLTFLWDRLKAVGAWVASVFGPVWDVVWQGIKIIFLGWFEIIKMVASALALLVPSFAGVDTAITKMSENWTKAMKDASKSTADATLAAKDFGNGFKDAANDVTSGIGGMSKELDKGKGHLKDFGDQARLSAEEIKRLSLTTRNAMGEMIQATDEWSRRSGAAFNQSANATKEAANSMISDLDAVTAAASRASDALQATASTTVADFAPKHIVKAAFESQGGDGAAFDVLMRALQTFDVLLGTPAGGPALQKLYDLLKQAPPEAAKSFVGNYPYVNTYLQSQGLPTFAQGGSFMVGGSGGTDSQLVQFMASPDEEVSIKTPAQQREGYKGNGGNTTVIMNVKTNDVNSFRRSKNQLALELSAKLANVGG